jgi:SAM-dependent methyltransferase
VSGDEANRLCGFCGSAEHDLVHAIHQRALQGCHADVVRCRRCGVARTYPLPTPEQLETIYNDDYFFYTNSPPVGAVGRAKHALKVLSLRHGLHLLYPYAFAPRVLAKRLRVLDVGCGGGRYVGLLKAAHPDLEICGVEPYREAAELARRATDCDVRATDLENAGWPDGYFDAVCFWDVFEHLERPDRIIREVSRILAPGGFVYFLIPNFASWESRTFGGHWWMLLFPQHLYHYTPDSLSEVCRSAGLEVERLSFPRTVVNLSWDLTTLLDSGRVPPLLARSGRLLLPLVKRLDQLHAFPSPRMFLAAKKA